MKCGLLQKILEKQDGSHLTQYLAVASVTISFFTVGIHQGWLAPTIPKLLSPEYPFDVTQEEASYIAIVSPIGHIAGGFLASYLSDVIGRKRTVLWTAAPHIISFILVSFSFYGKYLLYLARVIGGLSEGACVAMLPSYIAEITEPAVRGMLGTTVATTALLGLLFINILGSYVNIYVTSAICLIFPVTFLITFSHMPESPYFLLMQGRVDIAEKSLQVLRRKNDVKKELLQLTADVKRQMTETGTYKDMFTIESNRKALWMAIGARTFQQWTGCFAIMAYYQMLVAEATDFSPVLGSSLLTVVQILMGIASSFYISRVGRKKMFAWSSFFSSLTLAALAIQMTIRDYTAIDVSNISWLPLVYLTLFIIVFQAGLGSAINIFVGEIFSTSIKSKAFSLMGVVFASYLLLTTKFYQYTADNYGIAVPFWGFAFITFMGTWFFLFILPETQGKTLEMIQQELKGNKTTTG